MRNDSQRYFSIGFLDLTKPAYKPIKHTFMTVCICLNFLRYFNHPQTKFGTGYWLFLLLCVILFMGVGLCMMSLLVWLPGPMILFGGVSVTGPPSFRGVSVWGVSVQGCLYQGAMSRMVSVCSVSAQERGLCDRDLPFQTETYTLGQSLHPTY